MKKLKNSYRKMKNGGVIDGKMENFMLKIKISMDVSDYGIVQSFYRTVEWYRVVLIKMANIVS